MISMRSLPNYDPGPWIIFNCKTTKHGTLIIGTLNWVWTCIAWNEL